MIFYAALGLMPRRTNRYHTRVFISQPESFENETSCLLQSRERIENMSSHLSAGQLTN